MDSLQKKISAVLFVIFLTLVGLWLPHKPVNPTPAPIQSVLGEQTINVGLSDLIIEPGAGNKFLVDKISSSSQSIHMSMYLLSDHDIVDALIAAKNRGVEIKIILEKAPFGGGNINKTSRVRLETAGIPVQDPPALIALLHQKSLIIDRSELLILTLNLTTAAFTKNREYALSDRSPPDVAEAETIFRADWNFLPSLASQPNLVVSPDNSRAKITSLINSARKEIQIEDEVVEDKEIINLLVAKAKTTDVKIILADPKKVAQNITAAQDLRSGGVIVRFLHAPYLHAKLILIDNQYAYLGSVNLTRQSLDQNRELGIIFSNPDLVGQLARQFEKDWEPAQEN